MFIDQLFFLFGDTRNQFLYNIDSKPSVKPDEKPSDIPYI